MNQAKTIALTLGAFTLLTTSTVIAQTNAPVLKVVTPADSQTIYGNRIPVLISTENFEIVDYQQNATVKRGQGHIHLWLDDQNPTKESAVKLTSDSFTYSDVPYGDHTLRAELVNNNHTSLNPPEVVTIKFKSAQVASPLPAQATSFDKNTALIILVVVALVILAAWWYTKDEDEKESTSATTKTPKPTSRKTTKKKSTRERKARR
ncbi:MAG: hypothetical protein NUV69_00135 [Candidatus Curtissbacteria bacterium]|nr:hypothetical protein [Candidatus Curtissbacteria bacterium]